MKGIVFDTGPVISMTLNNLLWLLDPLKKKFGGEFFICPGVYGELIKKPLTTKKFKFEALQILPYIVTDVLKLYKSQELEALTKELMHLANNSFIARGSPIKAVHLGEVQAIATALLTGSDTLVIDERTTRTLIENPHSLSEHLQRKLHTHIDIDREMLDKLSEKIGHIRVIRSFELVTIAYEMGCLDRYMLDAVEKVPEVSNVKRAVLEGVLWAIKLSGCSVSRDEIYEIIDVEKSGK